MASDASSGPDEGADGESAGTRSRADATTGGHPADELDRPGEGGPRTALVTGCSTPVGRAIALAFREEGWRVYATAREGSVLDGLADRGCVTDEVVLEDDQDVRRIGKRVSREAGQIDCLVVLAGRMHLGPVEAVSLEAAREQFEANVFAPLRLLQSVLPHMRERGDGTVVVVTSVLGRLAAPGTGLYSGSQFAVEALCDSLRSEVADHGVDVTLVEPALIDDGVGGDSSAGDGDEEGDLADDADRDADGTAKDPYSSVYGLIDDVRALADGGPGSVPPERVGAVAVNAASATMPAPRYPVGTLADLLLKARYLPEDWRDFIFRLALRRA